MKVGFIGLGNVGSKLAGTLIRNNVVTLVHDQNKQASTRLVEMGVVGKILPLN